jgi:HEAT repeat protein
MDDDVLFRRLAEAGYPVGSVYELGRSGERYREALPVLLEALREEGDLRKKEWLVHALTRRWARREAAGPLIEEFKALPLGSGDPMEFYARWAVGSALEAMWDDSRFDELAALARDRRCGESRQMVVLGLGKSRRPEAVDVLLGELDDPDVDGHAVSALAKRPVPRARPALEGMADDPRPWVRKAARRGLAKLDAAAG